MNIVVTIENDLPLLNGFPPIIIEIPQINAREVLDLDFERLSQKFLTPDPITLDFLLIAGIVYVLDKVVVRRTAEDFWTRSFEVAFPVSDEKCWVEVRDNLQTCLGFLTGDDWSISFTTRSTDTSISSGDINEIKKPTASVVSLFSGGLDSLTHALNWQSTSRGPILLVGHYDAAGPASDQHRLFSSFSNLNNLADYSSQISVRVRPLPVQQTSQPYHIRSKGREPTLRSRSFLFLALGLYAAQTLGKDVPLFVPENGFIALNIPLTPSRIGSCSTRTTHPFFLNSFRKIAGNIGFANPIINPFELKTKGEVLAECLAPDLLGQLAPASVSCAHPSRRNVWKRKGARNCGYCVPCLVRRAALFHIGRDDGSAYGIDVLSGELPFDTPLASDWNAMANALDTIGSREEVEDVVTMTGPLSPEKYEDYIELVIRGLAELRRFISSKE